MQFSRYSCIVSFSLHLIPLMHVFALRCERGRPVYDIQVVLILLLPSLSIYRLKRNIIMNEIKNTSL